MLEDLLPAQNKSYQLGLKLNLLQHDVEAIHSTYRKPSDRILHIVIKFLGAQTDVESDYRCSQE